MSGMVAIDLQFAPGAQDPAGFEEFLDATADELTKLGVEPDYAADVSQLSASWWIDVPDASEQSLIDALTMLRTALHAAGAGTIPFGAATHEVTATRHITPA